MFFLATNFDFYPQVLHDYMIRDAVSWPQAILGAYLAECIFRQKKSRLETSRLSKEPYFQWINRDC